MKLDYSYINQLTNHDLEYQNKMLLILINELNLENQNLNNFMNVNNIKEMLNVIHKTKYKLNIFKLENEYNLILKIEEDLKNNIINNIEIKIHIENINQIIKQLSK